jgi:hypothetical protein
MHLPIRWTPKKKEENKMWWTSVRSIIALAVAGTFCYIAVKGKVDPKDFLIVVVLVFNYYFLNKTRPEPPSPTTEAKPNVNPVSAGGRAPGGAAPIPRAE